MCPPRRSFICAALISVVPVLCCAAQETLAPDEEHWRQARESYSYGDCGAAAVHLQKILQGDPSPHESAALLLLGRSYLRMNLLKKAQEAASTLIANFPHGRYAPFAHYLLAQVHFLQEDFYNSSLQLLEAAQSAEDDELNLLARTKLERLFEIYLRDDQRGRILQWVKSPEIQAELTSVQQGHKLSLKVGVILQFSEARRNEGQSILSGIEAAFAEARKKSRLDVEIVTRDSQGDVVEAIRAAQTLIAEEGVIALIGDLDGPCSAAIAAVAGEHQVPIIIPSSQEDGLTSISANAFQLMANLQIEGAAAAAFAQSDLGASRIAILAPASAAGMQRAKGFQDFLEHRGCEIVPVQWYYQETTDFRRQLESLACAHAPQIADSIIAQEGQIPVVLDSIEESAGEGTVYADTALANLPINRLDALYVPVQGDEMAFLAPQLAALGFHGTLVGSSVCLDLVADESTRRYVENMVFPSNFPSVEGWLQGSDFAKNYRSKTGVYPNRWNALGWDAFNFLAQALKDAAKLSPKKVAKRLKEIRHFQGAHLDLYFPEGERVNHALCFLKFENGQLNMIKSAQAVAQAQQP